MRTYTLTPAYGRDYRNGIEARAAFDAGKDWVDAGFGGSGRYINASDIPTGAFVKLRFKALAGCVSFRAGDPAPAPRVRRPRNAPRVRPLGYALRVTYSDGRAPYNAGGRYTRKADAMRQRAKLLRLARAPQAPALRAGGILDGARAIEVIPILADGSFGDPIK